MKLTFSPELFNQPEFEAADHAEIGIWFELQMAAASKGNYGVIPLSDAVEIAPNLETNSLVALDGTDAIIFCGGDGMIEIAEDDDDNEPETMNRLEMN